MNRRDLARNLAISLNQGAWHVYAVTDCLRRRLPTKLHPLCRPLADRLLLLCPQAYAPQPKAMAGILLDLHEFKKIFRYCHRRQIWPQADLTPARMAPADAFATLDLPAIPTVTDLADWLHLPKDKIDYFADVSSRHEHNGETAINHYHYHVLAKPSGGRRLIEAPKQTLKTLQRQILRDILNRVPVHDSAFGFVPGRNCLQAARRHVGEDVVLSFDLRDFFPSVSGGRVFGLFRSLGYPETVAHYLVGLCTNRTPSRVLHRMAARERSVYRQSHLPQGAPSSPALANLAAFALDRRLSGLARRSGARYSRYADDLSFSGDRHVAGTLAQTVPLIIRDEGFVPNPVKSRIMTAASRQKVTGVTVNQHLNIPRARFDHLKAILHACAKPQDTRLDDPQFRAAMIGQINWVAQVNPGRGAKLFHKFELALGAETGADRPL